jgi:hypothetical protein
VNSSSKQPLTGRYFTQSVWWLVNLGAKYIVHPSELARLCIAIVKQQRDAHHVRGRISCCCS